MICLFIIIVLLLQDKVVIKSQERKSSEKENNPDLPDIMGRPRPLKRQSVPTPANKGQIPETEIKSNNLLKFRTPVNTDVLKKKKIKKVAYKPC